MSPYIIKRPTRWLFWDGKQWQPNPDAALSFETRNEALKHAVKKKLDIAEIVQRSDCVLKPLIYKSPRHYVTIRL